MAVTLANGAASPFNTTPSASGTFIPQIWSGKLNTKFYATTVFGEIANTSYEGDIKNMGDTVWINNIPDVTVSSYQVGQNLAYQVPVPSVVELQITQGKYFAVNVNDVISMQSQPKLMDMFTSDAAKKMAIAVDRDILLNSVTTPAAANKGSTAGAISASYNLGSDTAPVTLSATSIVPLVTALASVLDEQNIPDTDRFLVITPYVRNWLMQSPLAQAYFTGDAESITRSGKIGKIDRFTIYVSNLMPSALAGFDYLGNADTGAVKRQCIYAGHKAAITFASQITKVENLPNPNDFGTLVRGLNVYGYTTILPNALALAQVV